MQKQMPTLLVAYASTRWALDSGLVQSISVLKMQCVQYFKAMLSNFACKMRQIVTAKLGFAGTSLCEKAASQHHSLC